MQVERLQELGLYLAARSASREWLFNGLFPSRLVWGGAVKSLGFSSGDHR